MKMNIFNNNEPREIHSKNNIFAEFLQTKGLYDKIDITQDNIYHLIDLIGGKVKIDEYCPCCKEKRIFNVKPIFYYTRDERTGQYRQGNLAEILETLQKIGMTREMKNDNGKKEFQWDWKNWECDEPTRAMVFKFECTMDPTHKLDYVVITDDYCMKKIGQLPSVADLSFPELKEYRKILSKDDEREYKRAVGLFAQGIGIGSFVYLRRIFERIIDIAKQKAINDGKIKEETYKDARVDERIKLLKDYLPKTLVESTTFYGIVSKGIHELSEDDCISFFPVLQSFTLMILRQWEELRKTEEEEKNIKQALEKITSQIKSQE